MKHIAVLAMSVCALLLAPSASAANTHRSDWYWNAYKSQTRLLYSAYGRTLGISRATCVGKGGSLTGGLGKPRLYQHFECFLNTKRGRYFGVLHVLDKTKFLFTIED